MLFNSLSFLVFLAFALAVFAALPPRFRWPWLLAASLFFYGYSEPWHLAPLGLVTAVVYGCSVAMGWMEGRTARRAFLVAGLVAVLGALVAFKFYDFLASEVERAWLGVGEDAAVLPRLGLATPMGFSFYAFMAASYLIDVYRGALAGERHAGHLALYVAWFPKILAGPIERATAFLPQVRTSLRANPTRLVLGLQLIGWGLFKKVVIADNLAPLVDRTFAIPAFAAPMELLVGVYFFAFQIYCDFSGYADIAIGASLLFGIKLMENFRRPYLARSTAEFWAERWHISLGHWFRDYLYVPLGGSRGGTLRRYLNVMAVFVVSGLWHAGLGYGVGWSFLVWGTLNGAYQWGGLATRDLWRRLGSMMPRFAASGALAVVRTLVTFHLIAIAWVFFRAETIRDATTVLTRLWAALPTLPGLATRYPFTGEHALGFGLIALLMVVEVLDERRPIAERLATWPQSVRWAVYYACLFALLIVGSWGGREFIYLAF